MYSQINEAGEQLENAFQLFNQFSEKLADSYSDLEQQVTRLTQELAKERSKRLIQLAEKEVLAKRLETLFDALPAGVVLLDSAGQITQTNRIAQQMLDIKSSDDPFTDGNWEKIAADTFNSDGDELRLKDGRWINLSASQLNDEAEKIILISDVSETHALHEMLNRQQRLSSLGEMIASLAHQIRTPLSSALLNISNSNHPANNEERRLRFTEKAKERLRHLEHMVDDMLIFARGDVSDAEYLSAKTFCQQLKSTLSLDYASQQISFQIGRELGDVTIKANLDILLSAVQNIVDNAIEASDSETNIIINAGLNNENKFELSIQDYGCGMTQQTIGRILEPFFTTRTNGTGLGLAVVNATVNRFNGEMTIDSTPGEGSVFSLQFPRAETNAMLHSNLTGADHHLMLTGAGTDFSHLSMQTNSTITGNHGVAL